MLDSAGCVACFLTYLSLMTLDLILMALTGSQLWKMKKEKQSSSMSQRGLFTCRQSFHLAIFLLVSLRAIQFGLFSLSHMLLDVIDSVGLFYDLVSVFGSVCAILYCQAYSILLIFWVSVLQKVAKRTLSFKPVLHQANMFTFISLVFFCVLGGAIVIFYILAAEYQERVLYWNVQSAIVASVMGLEALAFLTTAALMYHYSKKFQFSTRTKQVILVACVISVLFILRMIYILVSTFAYNLKWWWIFLLFYVVLEDVPIAMMLFFQKSYPKKVQTSRHDPSSLPPVDPATTTYSMLPSQSTSETELDSWEDLSESDDE